MKRHFGIGGAGGKDKLRIYVEEPIYYKKKVIYIWQRTDTAKTLNMAPALVQEGFLPTGFDR